MNSTIVINKIFLDNYKLFENFTLNFKEGLNIFDGPNGYGKTSFIMAQLSRQKFDIFIMN